MNSKPFKLFFRQDPNDTDFYLCFCLDDIEGDKTVVNYEDVLGGKLKTSKLLKPAAPLDNISSYDGWYGIWLIEHVKDDFSCSENNKEEYPLGQELLLLGNHNVDEKESLA